MRWPQDVHQRHTQYCTVSVNSVLVHVVVPAGAIILADSTARGRAARDRRTAPRRLGFCVGPATAADLLLQSQNTGASMVPPDGARCDSDHTEPGGGYPASRRRRCCCCSQGSRGAAAAAHIRDRTVESIGPGTHDRGGQRSAGTGCTGWRTSSLVPPMVAGDWPVFTVPGRVALSCRRAHNRLRCGGVLQPTAVRDAPCRSRYELSRAVRAAVASPMVSLASVCMLPAHAFGWPGLVRCRVVYGQHPSLANRQRLGHL